MRKLPWAALCLIVATAALNVVFTGCGSESVVGETPDGGDPSEAGNEAGDNPDTSTNPPDAAPNSSLKKSASP